jgi:hypothetical protein
LRRLLALTLLLALAGCAAVPTAPPPPRLVVLFALDGFPQRQLVGYLDQLAPDGLRRFIDRGAWFSNGLQGHSLTNTAPGHAVMLTGAYPRASGIISNEWRDPVTFTQQYCVADAEHTYIGEATAKLAGTSPRNLEVETVGDVLRRLEPRSKVISVSAMDRGAILTAGHAGTAFIYQTGSGRFASSTYYMREHPPWVVAFNARRPADRFFRAEWNPLLPAPAYARSVPDDQPWFAPGGHLPKVMGEGAAAPGPAFYSDLRASPFMDELVIEFARAAMAAERLGSDDAPDILVVSLKAHDFINHAWSAESRLSHDHVLRLDTMLQDFFAHLDAAVGKDRYLAVLTSDHGFTPAPEYSAAQGLNARRFNLNPGVARIGKALEATFGPGKWLLGRSADTLVANRALARERGVDVDKVIDEARRLLLEEPVIEAAYTRAEMESRSRAGAPWFERMYRTFHPQRSGDVQFVIKRYWMLASPTSRTAATHGSPHPEDSIVPIAFYGPAWIAPGRNDAPVETADIAPTLARILRVPAPSASEGRVLPILAVRP